MAFAFDGIRVIDFTQVIAGPFATQQLASLGAQVIKIEQRGSGDTTRGLMSTAEHGMSPTFLTCNIGKRSLTLNLKSSAAKDIVHRLVKTADVVVENFKPGVMARLGFDYPTLCNLKPDLVYCAISGYGHSGPKSPLPAFDGAIQADSGMMSISGHTETGPTRAGYFAVDMATALHAAFAISAALYRCRATGAGQHIDVAMMDTAIVMQAAQVTAHLVNGVIPDLIGNKSPTKQPTANVFSCADGFIQVIALKEDQVERLFTLLGLQTVYAQEPFCRSTSRVANSEQVHSTLNAELKRKPTNEWLALFAQRQIPASAVNDYPTMISDPQLAARNVFTDVPSPNEPGAMTRAVFSGHTADIDGPSPMRPPPGLGQHSEEILLELGYSRDDIRAFADQGVI
ncbi:MAG: CoA transferase [Proteobacteria bacterium]|nr:CoA transferase [Pseudomonadota bacterium]